MPAQIVVVLREHALADRTAEALTEAGYETLAIRNSLDALRVLETAHSIELLITSANFSERQPNGLAIARMVRTKRPHLKVIFANGPDTEPHVAEDGTFIPTPTTAELIVYTAKKVMKAAA
jgi:DNA-binding NtrC family response regulator